MGATPHLTRGVPLNTWMDAFRLQTWPESPWKKVLHVHASCCVSLLDQQDLYRQAMAGCGIIRHRITDTSSYGIASGYGRLHGEYARIRRIRPVAQVVGRCRVGGLQRRRQAVRRAPQRLKLLYRQRDALLPW